MTAPTKPLGSPTPEFPNDDARAQFERAVGYHQAADLLLQHRLNTFIVAQAFLAGAFFTSHIAADPSAFLVSARIALVVLAIAYSVAFLFVSIRMTGGLDRLKAVMLRDPVFALYYLPKGGRPGRGWWTRWFNPVIPLAALTFWVAVSLVGGVA